MISKEQGIEKADASDDVIYRIEVPANRYDLLCVEGLVRAILIFLQKIPLPQFTVKPGKQVVTVTPSVSYHSVKVDSFTLFYPFSFLVTDTGHPSSCDSCYFT